MTRIIALFSLVMISACAQFPELDAQVDPGVYDRDAPRLLPLDQLIAAPGVFDGPELERSLTGRVANLRARASRLRGRVVDPATRRRMRGGVTVPDL